MDVDIYIEDRKWKLIGKLEREEGKRCFAYSRGLIKTDGVRARAVCVRRAKIPSSQITGTKL